MKSTIPALPPLKLSWDACHHETRRPRKRQSRQGNKATREQVRELVELSGISVAGLARAMGIPPKTLRSYRSGERTPNVYVLGAIKWTLLMMGKSIATHPDEIARVAKELHK